MQLWLSQDGKILLAQLLDFDFSLHDIEGSKNVVVDFLSGPDIRPPPDQVTMSQWPPEAMSLFAVDMQVQPLVDDTWEKGVPGG